MNRARFVAHCRNRALATGLDTQLPRPAMQATLSTALSSIGADDAGICTHTAVNHIDEQQTRESPFIDNKAIFLILFHIGPMQHCFGWCRRRSSLNGAAAAVVRGLPWQTLSLPRCAPSLGLGTKE